MKKSLLSIILISMVAMLSSCGGGGDAATGGRGPSSSSLKITATPIDSSLPANTLGWPNFSGSPFQTQVNVKVTYGNGQEVATGTIVHMQTNNDAVASVGIPDDPNTDENEFAQNYVGANQETIGATATYYIRSHSPGAVSFTINATNPQTNRNESITLNYTVTEGPDPQVTRLTVVTPRTTLPANTQNIPYFEGSPFVMETDVQFRDIFGNLTNPVVADSGFPEVNVSISPSNVLYFTTRDYVDTTNINEFLDDRLNSIRMTAGHGPLFLWSRGIAGVATVTISATEAGSGFVYNYSFDVEVVNDGTDPGLPSSVSLISNSALYINGSGGATSQAINITVNSGNVGVLDPQVNNVKLSITTDSPNSGEKLSGVNVSGANVQGSSINIATLNGIANAQIFSGSSSNNITLTVTVDRADNNVDNGIQDGLSTSYNYVVSDGALFALDLTSPALDSLTVNSTLDNVGNIDFQDGTYSLIVSAIATDRSGNPALPQTLKFGMINSPIVGYPDSGSGSFVHSGIDGDPQEGGSQFTANSGRFITNAGGVQANDTLIVFGEESLGNEDLESALPISSINSQTRVNVVGQFNRNDGSGTINNDFGSLPYAIGRPVDGNITVNATINENGVATTRLNYPVSQLGKIAIIYVTGQGSVTNGVTRTVTDAELTAFPGVEGFNGNSSTLIVSPSVIPANSSNSSFTVCLADSAQNPLPGRFVSFNYIGEGFGSIDGQSSSGVMNRPTGSNGCTTGFATTSGLAPASNAHTNGFNFNSGGLTCNLSNSTQTTCLEVVAPSTGVLNANPSSYIGSGNVPITLTLFDGSGTALESIAISGSCEGVDGGSLGIISGPTVTDTSGQSFVTIAVSLDAPNGGLSGKCTFKTPNGNQSVDVNFSGGDSCNISQPSPPPPVDACTAGP